MAVMASGTLLTVAPTGAETAKSDAPALPVTVDELVSTAKACQAAGAAVIHVHVRHADARPTGHLGRDREIVPEFELFDLGHVATMTRLLDRHGAPYGGHVHCDLVMGVPGGMPGTAAALVACVSALPAGATFSATGVGRTTLPVMLAS